MPVDFDPWQPEDPETEGTKPGLEQVLMDLRIWDARVAARRKTAFVKTVEMPQEIQDADRR